MLKRSPFKIGIFVFFYTIYMLDEVKDYVVEINIKFLN